jgi:hypothetical protein
VEIELPEVIKLHHGKYLLEEFRHGTVSEVFNFIDDGVFIE